jgi:hypothetical protein
MGSALLLPRGYVRSQRLLARGLPVWGSPHRALLRWGVLAPPCRSGRASTGLTGTGRARHPRRVTGTGTGPMTWLDEVT